MTSIPHRELRNDSSRILERVRNGEVIEVTNHGELVAVLVPPSTSAYDRLLAAGKVRLADPKTPVDLRKIKRRPAAVATAEILDDVRADR